MSQENPASQTSHWSRVSSSQLANGQFQHDPNQQSKLPLAAGVLGHDLLPADQTPVAPQTVGESSYFAQFQRKKEAENALNCEAPSLPAIWSAASDASDFV